MEQHYDALITEELRELKCFLCNHIWLFLLNVFLNIYFFIKMYFLNKVYVVFYLICYIILIVLLGIPFYPLILLTIIAEYTIIFV